MDDLISRQAAIDEAEEWIETYSSGRGGQRERDTIKHVIDGIKKLPVVQPKIIRCKDCRYYKTYQYVNGIRKFLPKCSFNDIYVAEEDFCSKAERKTDG